MSETVRETEDFIHEQLFGEGPKSVGEAVEEERRVIPGAPPPEDAPIVVEDEPPGRDTGPDTPAPELPAEPAAEPGEEATEEDTPPEDEGVVWAKRKYGDDPEKWARAAYDQERHISTLAREKREADELASQWYEYAQQVEAQAQQQTSSAMPLSAQEENWVEQSLMDPLGYARTAAMNGKPHLYQGVINRVAEENPGLAASIGTQVQMELQSYAEQAEAQPQPVTLEQALAESFNRLGLNLPKLGPGMAQKIGELGEYHPYVRAIMEGDDAQRDLGVQAVADLVRATSFSPRQVTSQENIRKENELRRDASSVQAGGLSAPPSGPPVSPLMAGMREEWERRGQWQEDE